MAQKSATRGFHISDWTEVAYDVRISPCQFSDESKQFGKTIGSFFCSVVCLFEVGEESDGVFDVVVDNFSVYLRADLEHLLAPDMVVLLPKTKTFFQKTLSITWLSVEVHLVLLFGFLDFVGCVFESCALATDLMS